MEIWRQIREFPSYSVGDEGHVKNNESSRMMTLLVNQRGLVNVGLTKNGVQHKRSVALLVANVFVPKLDHQRDTFDTPINLDGDRLNNCALNLMWRPRWFAVKYARQFNNDLRGFVTPVEEVNTGMQFETSWEAATTFGLIDREIMTATMNRTYVWPTYQKFRVI